MRFRVIEDWQATYADPIRVAEGEAVHLSGCRDNWDGHVWLWARTSDGLEGWIPDDLVGTVEGGHVARADYSAVELTCRVDQVLTGTKETHGWVFCIAKGGASGWVPRKNLHPDDQEGR